VQRQVDRQQLMLWGQGWPERQPVELATERAKMVLVGPVLEQQAELKLPQLAWQLAWAI